MGTERRTYLLGGRRVAVIDLIDAGLLAPGDILTFRRPRVGKTYKAIVEERGSLRIGGRSYATPSQAAQTVTGVLQMDGWTAWVTDGNRSLSSLRVELLDVIADGAADPEAAPETSSPDDVESDGTSFEDAEPDEPATTLLHRHVFLKDARQAADSDSPVTVPVRALLARWGGRARGHTISRRIQTDLDNHGLVTRPNFMRVSLDDDVALMSVEHEEAVAPAPDVPVLHGPGPAGKVASALADEPTACTEIGLTLGNLLSADRVPVYITSMATLSEALTLMLMNDYSQLPVLATDNFCIGAVTWKSIAYAQLKDPEERMITAAIVPASIRRYDRDLFDVLPLLQAENFVVVTDDRNQIKGIVTTADIVGLYGSRTLPFLLIGELDQELRKLMLGFDFKLVRDICAEHGGKALKTYDDMTMFHYENVLGNADCWDVLGWPLDGESFVRQLATIRHIRNDVMHFNPDGVPENTVDMLRHMLALIREFGPPDPAL